MSPVQGVDKIEAAGKRVLVRVDLNVPMKDGKVTDPTRIERTVPTLADLADRGAKVIVMSHFGRPDGKVVPAMSLKPLTESLSRALGGRAVAFAPDCIGPVAEAAVKGLPDGGIVLLENLRFHAGEEGNDRAFAQSLARLGEIYVNDAFATAHRAHASTEGLAHHLPAFAGRLMQEELTALDRALENPARPVAAIVGGAKVSSKLAVLANLVAKADILVIGGGMANTFLFAQGLEVGKSLCERDLAATARDILAQAKARKCEIVLPVDAVVAEKLESGAPSKIVPIGAVPTGSMILDVGPASAKHIVERLGTAKTVVWNGPLGAFELKGFDQGTVVVAQAVARLTTAGKIASVAGGGDTVAALTHSGVTEAFTYVSTAGGAFLEWLEGKDLPGVAALRRKH